MSKGKTKSYLSPDLHELRQSFLSLDAKRQGKLKNAPLKKILVMGSPNTGKSSILLKFLFNFPEGSQGPEENYYTSIRFKNEEYMLHLVDHAGVDEYTPIYAGKYTSKVDGYIFVYSVADRSTFEFVQKLRDQFHTIHGKHVPTVLVANKCDLKEKRAVTTLEGKKLAEEMKVPFFEVSAKKHSKDVVGKIFETAIQEVIKAEKQNPKQLKMSGTWTGNTYVRLRKAFQIINGFVIFLGLCFIGYSIYDLITFEELNKVGILMVLVLLDGFILVTLALLGAMGMHREETDCIAIYTVMSYVGMLLSAGCVTLLYVMGDTTGTKIRDPLEEPVIKMAMTICFGVVLCMIITNLIISGVIKKIQADKRGYSALTDVSSSSVSNRGRSPFSSMRP